MCQSLPGLRRTATSTILAPSMVKFAGALLSCCERISELPSPLKSAASALCQADPGLGWAAPRLRLVPSMIQAATRLVDPAASITVPGTPIVPSPLRSCWKLVSDDCSALLLPDKTTPVDMALPLLSVVQTEY